MSKRVIGLHPDVSEVCVYGMPGRQRRPRRKRPGGGRGPV